MTDREAILVLVKDERRRERVRDELARLNVNGYAVRASDATSSIFTMCPIAAVLDEAHAAVALGRAAPLRVGSVAELR